MRMMMMIMMRKLEESVVRVSLPPSLTTVSPGFPSPSVLLYSWGL